MFSRRTLFIPTLATACSFGLALTQADEKQPVAPKAKPAKSSPLERFKALAGEWSRVDDNEKSTMLSYRITAGGSAVVETIMPGQDHEMVTLYHMDGDTLMLTHYCAMGNQPRMKAVKVTDDKVTFDFAGGTNMKPSDTHMHAAEFTFTDKDHFKSRWTHYANGKSTGDVEMNMVRKAK